VKMSMVGERFVRMQKAASIEEGSGGELETMNMVAVHYSMDARASRFTVQAVATGVLAAMGHNPLIGIRNFKGDVNFSPETLEGNSFHISIESSSLNVQNDISDKDRREIERLMNEQVLETAKYPEIVFDVPSFSATKMGDSLYLADLRGSLTLHGVTNSQHVAARVAVFGDLLRASGDFTLSQTDYQIKLVSVAGGALKLKDDLKFSFEIVARKQG
jgi:polyisoprenoid-binding protein YceI